MTDSMPKIKTPPMTFFSDKNLAEPILVEERFIMVILFDEQIFPNEYSVSSSQVSISI